MKTPQGWLASKTLQLIVAALLGALLLAGITKVFQWREGARQNESRQRNEAAAAGTAQDGQAAAEARREADFSNVTGREAFNQALTKETRDDPEAADRAARRVSDARLRAFRDRREARERAARRRLDAAGVQR